MDHGSFDWLLVASEVEHAFREGWEAGQGRREVFMLATEDGRRQQTARAFARSRVELLRMGVQGNA